MAVKVLWNSIFSLVILRISLCAGELTLSSAKVREGEVLKLTCQSTEPFGLYTFYSLTNQGNEMYGIGTGSFQTCQTGMQTGYVMECDFDNWIFNLTILQPVHDQVIYCRKTTGPDQIIIINATIFVQVPVKRIVLSTPSRIDVVSGSTYTLTCKTFASRPAADILWHINSTTLAGNTSVVSQNELKYDVNSTLTLTFTKRDHGKEIYCSSNYTFGEIPLESTKTFLNILYTPSTSPQLTSAGPTSVDEGQSIILFCKLSTLGNPPVIWSWICGNDSLTNGVVNTGTLSVLTLIANRKYNKMTCHCRARTPSVSLAYDRKSTAQSLTVFYVPSIAPQLDALSSTLVEEGQTITLRCKLHTLGNPHVAWSWVCGNVTQTNGVINTGNQSVLTLTASKKLNRMTCHCRARTQRESLSYDRVSEMRSLTVYYISEVQIIPGNVLNIVTGQKLALISCYTESANPEGNLTYRWIKDDGFNTSLVSTSQFYLIKLAKVEDSGRYICTVSNSMVNSSGFIDVNVQSKPLPPTIIQVLCKTRYAYILLLSSYLGIQGKQILQYSNMDNIFKNATSSRMNKTQPDIDIFKVLNLSSGTEYTFRIQASILYGITLSESQRCSTDVDAQAGRRESCEIEPIIGGTLGCLLFINILFLGVITFYKFRRQWINKGNRETASRSQDARYVEQTLPSEVHYYPGISTIISKETVNTNTYEKIEECHEKDKRSEYMELTQPCTQEVHELHKEDTDGMYSNVK